MNLVSNPIVQSKAENACPYNGSNCIDGELYDEGEDTTTDCPCKAERTRALLKEKVYAAMHPEVRAATTMQEHSDLLKANDCLASNARVAVHRHDLLAMMQLVARMNKFTRRLDATLMSDRELVDAIGESRRIRKAKDVTLETNPLDVVENCRLFVLWLGDFVQGPKDSAGDIMDVLKKRALRKNSATWIAWNPKNKLQLKSSDSWDLLNSYVAYWPVVKVPLLSPAPVELQGDAIYVESGATFKGTKKATSTARITEAKDKSDPRWVLTLQVTDAKPASHVGNCEDCGAGQIKVGEPFRWITSIAGKSTRTERLRIHDGCYATLKSFAPEADS